ncbi:MAG: YciI family protein [Geminicoccaceae bacterium]
MPKWDDYKKIASERGALAFELFVVQSTPCASPEDVKAVLPKHLDYQRQMEAEGKLFLAGPLSDETGEEMQGAGLIIYRARAMDEARRLADADPMHAEGKRQYSLRKWLVNEGLLSFSLALSNQKLSMG